jgi:hypothetical protein
MMMRNWFVREEAGRLIIGSGIPALWLDEDASLMFGPTPTPYGTLTVFIDGGDDGVDIPGPPHQMALVSSSSTNSMFQPTIFR